ncbi:host attachment protein [Acetobacter okinawensis]|uniref:baeRF12 domain-containing protein n=1 Tax=Acetobacter okinawensis TaxID=1076594 RepID=UPI0039EB10D3
MTEERDGLVVYVVADGGKVRFLHDAQGEMRDVSDVKAEGHEDTPGKLPPETAPRTAAKEGFARNVADRINAMVAHGDKVAGFVIAAPAPVMHDIRAHLSKPAEAKVIKTLIKDLTNIPAHDLHGHFDIPATGWVLPG